MGSKKYVGKYSQNQLSILSLLLERSYIQKELQKHLEWTSANLHYHLGRLEKDYLIKKTTLQQIGNAKINEIKINPSALQMVRRLLKIKIINQTLITGFGLTGTGYRIPDQVFQQLKKSYYPITRIVCFTSHEAKAKWEDFKEQEALVDIHKFYFYTYPQYRGVDSDFAKDVEGIISEELKTSDVIIDITPLTKTYSLKMLEISNTYQLPAIYLGMDDAGGQVLLKMSNLKLSGKISDQF